MRAQVEKLRVQLAECELIRDLATDPKKRELFARLAEHLKVLAADIEKTMGSTDPFFGKTQDPVPKQDEWLK
jgi:hypothetical protein